MTPGIHPKRVSIKTINTEPQPLSITDKGGNKMANNTLHKLINGYKDITNLKTIKN